LEDQKKDLMVSTKTEDERMVGGVSMEKKALLGGEVKNLQVSDIRAY